MTPEHGAMSVTTPCAVCNETHTAYARTMPDDTVHVFQSPDEYARRNAATLAFKQRYNTAVTISPFVQRARAGLLPAKDLTR